MSDSDPFEKARKEEGVLTCPFQGEELLIYNEGYKMLYNEEADPHHMLKFR